MSLGASNNSPSNNLRKLFGTIDEELSGVLNSVKDWEKAIKGTYFGAAEDDSLRELCEQKYKAERELVAAAKSSHEKAKKDLKTANSKKEDTDNNHESRSKAVTSQMEYEKTQHGKNIKTLIDTHGEKMESFYATIHTLSEALRTTQEEARVANKAAEKALSHVNLLQEKADCYFCMYDHASQAVVHLENKGEAEGEDLKRKATDDIDAVQEQTNKRIKVLQGLKVQLSATVKKMDKSFCESVGLRNGTTDPMGDHNESLFEALYNGQGAQLNLLGKTMMLIHRLDKVDWSCIPKNGPWYEQTEVALKALSLKSNTLTTELNTLLADQKIGFITINDYESIGEGVTEWGIIETTPPNSADPDTKHNLNNRTNGSDHQAKREYIVIRVCKDSIVAYSPRTEKVWTCPKKHESMFKLRNTGGTLMDTCVSLLSKGLNLGFHVGEKTTVVLRSFHREPEE